MIFSLIFATILVAPLVALVWTVRDRQLMAPGIGPVDSNVRFRAEGRLRGAVVPLAAVWPLARIEAVRLVRHPANYLIGLPLIALGLSNYLYGSVVNLATGDVDIIVLLVPLAWGTLIASNLLTLRSRRWKSEELLATTAVPRRSRTLAHLLASVAMLPVGIVVTGLCLVVARASGRSIGSPRADVLLLGPLLVVGAGVLGVAVARWLPRPVFGWVAVIATVVLQVNFGHLDTRWRWLHFSMYANESLNYTEIAPQPHVLHLAYVVGGILLVAAIALARDGLDVRAGALAAGAALLMLVTGVVQTLPISDRDAQDFAARLQSPATGQRCETRNRYVLCSDPAYAALVPEWTAVTDGVLARVPDGAIPRDLVLRQRAMIDARVELPPEVAAQVDPAVAWPDDDEVALSRHWSRPAPAEPHRAGFSQLGLGYRVASRVVGLPPDAWWSESSNGGGQWATIPQGMHVQDDERDVPVQSPFVQCRAWGEARAVAALWLAGQSSPDTRAALRRLAGDTAGWKGMDTAVAVDFVDTYRATLPGLVPESGATLRASDVATAAALLDRNDDEVAALLHQHWGELTDTAKPLPTEELQRWFGLDNTRALAAVMPYRPSEDDDRVQADTPVVTGSCADRRR